MDEIKVLVNALSKDELVAVVRRFRIEIHGFQRNFELAPIEMLRSFLIKELKQGLRPKRKGRKNTTIPEVYELISSSFAQKHPDFEKLSLEEMGLMVEMGLEYSPGAILSLVYTKFPSKYEEYKVKLADNMKEGEPLLNGIFKELTVDEKMNILREEVLTKADLYSRLKEYISQIEEEKGEVFYGEVHRKVNHSDEKSFINELFVTPTNFRHIPMLAFLIEKNRYLEANYSFLLQHVIQSFDDQKLTEVYRTVDGLEEEVDKKENELCEIKGESKRLEDVEEHYGRLKERYTEVNQDNEALRASLVRLSEIQKSNEPFLRYFHNLLAKHRAIIVTSDTELFRNMEIMDYVEGVQEFHCHRKGKNTHRYQDKTVLISRTSFVSTSEWMVTKRFFESSNIYYFELSGYDISGYIEQIIENLHKERMRIY
ncbi:hypothetical protein FITA111629_05160 [Filibacter tadaridae]|uniref:Uncharacterized protein n=1 Tax=Filibacter tadaridae TaxID=2483811 RepID=A0A3P5XCH4_9BACL|nr:hypothetical protein [Filibacter tadaridae]VDC32366.1 hypothetical protein FILTAD_02599 [Filibacter tadaridae]